MDAVCSFFSIKGRREKNDDRALINQRISDSDYAFIRTAAPVTIAVCDGCGGYKGGDVASGAALEVISMMRTESMAKADSIHAMLRLCNEHIDAKKRQDPALEEMCTTIAGCILTDERVVVFNSGDTRVYRADRSRIALLTQDHTMLADIERLGVDISESDKPSRNIITRCLGTESAPADVQISEYAPLPGDSYIICSDGLWDYVADRDIFAVMRDDAIPQEDKVKELVRMAYDAGSNDNITVCICSFPGDGIQAEQRSDDLILD